MTSKILTFVDASALIYAAVKPTAATFQRRMRALQVLWPMGAEFVSAEKPTKPIYQAYARASSIY